MCQVFGRAGETLLADGVPDIVEKESETSSKEH
jgi:hypothetical protein